MKKITVCVVVFMLLFYTRNDIALANGFKILGVKSVKASAMGEAFVAQADDPSAIAFNPAGLPQVKGTQCASGVVMTNAWVDHMSTAGVKEEVLDKWQYVPSLFFTTDLGMEDIVAGLGITVPNGLGSTWSDKGFARYVATYSDLRVIDMNPSIGWQINEQFSMGAGGSYYYSDVTLDSRLDYGTLLGSPGSADGKSHLTGSGDGWGYNAGVLWKMTEKQTCAFTFKSPYTIKYTGVSKITDIPGALGVGTAADTMLKAKINFPAVLNLGYAYRPAERLKLEVDLDWTRWESVNSVVVDFIPAAVADVTYEYEFENTFAYKFGAEYLLTDSLKLRGGYIFNSNATPERNWRPSLPDTNTHFLCSGLGYETNKFVIDTAVQAIFYEDREINNNVDLNETNTASSIDGEYETFALLFAVGFTYKF